jgi:hypothetical protein
MPAAAGTHHIVLIAAVPVVLFLMWMVSRLSKDDDSADMSA